LRDAFFRAVGGEGLKNPNVLWAISQGGNRLAWFLTVLKAFGPSLAVAIGAYLRGKYGGKVKLKFRDITLEASSVEEVEVLLKLAAKHYRAIRGK
jgi:hypothetical protein